MIFDCVYRVLNVSYFSEAQRKTFTVSSRVWYTRLSRGSLVTKIKMYASQTRKESTSGEVEACPINHPSLKISSSTWLGLREADHAVVATRATFYCGCFQKEKKKKSKLAAAGNNLAGKSQVNSLSMESSFKQKINCLLVNVYYFWRVNISANCILWSQMKKRHIK